MNAAHFDGRPFADLLRSYRAEAGLSQEEVAQRAQLSVNAVSALERGIRRAPRRQTVAAIASALRLDSPAFTRLEESARRARSSGTSRHDSNDPSTSVPQRLTSFLGRRDECNAVRRLLEQHALVTVAGAGGIGKTRLAIEVAVSCLPEFGAVRFADLATINEASLVAIELAKVLDPSVGGSTFNLDAALERLARQRILLIIDNCEHVISEVAHVVGSILQRASDVRVMATSREALGISGEAVFRLSPMSVPPPRATFCEASRYDSVLLFEDRAKLAMPAFTLDQNAFDAVSEICRRLDGLPLAIELTASLAGTLPLHEIAATLDDRLATPPIRTRDSVPRQRTLAATIAWSYDLLEDTEKEVLRQLSIFCDGWTLDAAIAVCGPANATEGNIVNTISSLVEKSLVAIERRPNSVSYRLLESIRAFARAQLAQDGDADATSRRHARWVATLARSADDVLWLTKESLYYAKFGGILDDARAAVSWALGPGEEPLLAGDIVAGLRWTWRLSGLLSELRERAQAVLNRIEAGTHIELAARLHRALSLGAIDLGREYFPINDRAIAINRRAGDEEGIGVLDCGRALAYFRVGDLQQARIATLRGLTRLATTSKQPSFPFVSFVLTDAAIAIELELFDDANARIAQAIALARRLDDQILAGRAAAAMATLHSVRGEPDRALHEAIKLLETRALPIEGLYEAELHVDIAACRLALGDNIGALRSARHSIARTHAHDTYVLFLGSHHLAAALAGTGDLEGAAMTLGFIENSIDVRGWRGRSLERRDLELLEPIVRAGLDSRDLVRTIAAGRSMRGDQLA